MNDPIEVREIGDYRINIYYDSNAMCPCTDWDMVACYLWNYSDWDKLSSACDWKEVFGKYGKDKYSLTDSLRQLIDDNVDYSDLVQHFKDGKVDNYRLIFNDNRWRLEWYNRKKDAYVEINDFGDYELEENLVTTDELLESLEKEELVEILNELCKDIFVKEWCSRGYCQGDYVEGIAFCTKERFERMVSKDTTDWKKKADSFIDGEVECIGMWMWGDVKGFTLEHKVPFTKVYNDTEREDEEDYDWEEIDSCWGYFMETDELIDEVIKEHDLK